MLIRVTNESRKRFDTLMGILNGSLSAVESSAMEKESALIAYNDLIAILEVLREKYIQPSKIGWSE
jgi:hypothetical protein